MLICVGGILISTGMQIVINNAWNIFDDQATPFIIIGSLMILGVIKSAFTITADYLKIWMVNKTRQDVAPDERTLSDEENFEQIVLGGEDGRNIHLRAPVGSVLYNWPEPSPGDKGGWDRYRLAYLKENQLWLQAHMESIIDSKTTIDYRRKLMDSLAKVLKESNIIQLQQLQQQQSSGSLYRALEISSAPLHEGAVMEVVAAKEEFRNTAVELAAKILLDRARFINFLTQSIADIRLAQAVRILDFCESCGTIDSLRSNLAIVPEYPVSYVADQFRIQRGYPETWNVPLWEQYYQQMTPVCTICSECRIFYANRNQPIQIGQLMSGARGSDLQSKPCREVIRELQNRYPNPPTTIPLDAARALSRWFRLATEICDPRVSDSRIESVLMQAGYKRSTGTSVSRRRIVAGPTFEANVQISEIGRKVLLEWVQRARMSIRQRLVIVTNFDDEYGLPRPTSTQPP
jgi:hypothetical protein